jgi:hypothetical protein
MEYRGYSWYDATMELYHLWARHGYENVQEVFRARYVALVNEKRMECLRNFARKNFEIQKTRIVSEYTHWVVDEQGNISCNGFSLYKSGVL